MMEFYVSAQSLKFYTPVIAADSLSYLSAKVNFTDGDWEGYSKWLHFRKGDGPDALVYDMQLDENNEIRAEQKLNLSTGRWEVYLTGTKEDTRLTTVPVILTVKESGLIDAPLHELPMSVAEQVDYNAAQALEFARAVKTMADEGAFDGKDGTSLSPIGHFSGPDELEALVINPAAGDVYSVGTELPYDLYVWDGINLQWRNHGQLQGAQGERGERGVTFIPSVSANGNITWTNDGGLENPEMRNITGPAGKNGETGPAGPGAYEKAQEAGYTGTEATFYQALTYMPYHNRRHLPDGADPLEVQTGNLTDQSVTLEKINDAVKTVYFALTLGAENWQGDAAPYSQTVEVEGLKESDRPKVYFTPPEDFESLEDKRGAYSLLYDVEAEEGKATLCAMELPELEFDITLEVTRI